jgi:SAM-dependent methyltransferase
MYRHEARLYDLEYAEKDYAGEAARLHELIQARSPRAQTLLDVACGTGKHLEHLRAWYDAEGLDADGDMLAMAGERLGDLPLHQADMRNFDLGRRFDAVTCLFSAIGYMRNLAGLTEAVEAMARHLAPGGVLVVEPWVTPERWIDDHVSSLASGPLARVDRSWREDGLSVLEQHYLLGSPEGIRYWVERHELGLFTDEEYAEAFRAVGLAVEHDPDGLIGRGLYLGVS